VLPRQKTVLFTSLTTDTGTERIEAVTIDPLKNDGQKSGVPKRWVVIEHAVTPVWSPTGHLLFGRDGAVWAMPFDESSATIYRMPFALNPNGKNQPIRIMLSLLGTSANACRKNDQGGASQLARGATKTETKRTREGNLAMLGYRSPSQGAETGKSTAYRLGR
jgi:hypothetical protein